MDYQAKSIVSKIIRLFYAFLLISIGCCCSVSNISKLTAASNDIIINNKEADKIVGKGYKRILLKETTKA